MAAQTERGAEIPPPFCPVQSLHPPHNSSGPGQGWERDRGLGTSERWGAGVAETSWEGGAKEAVYETPEGQGRHPHSGTIWGHGELLRKEKRPR